MAYVNPDYTLEELNEAMEQLVASYGSSCYDEIHRYKWGDVSHI